MNNSKTKIHIACTIDDKYVQHCGVMLCSLFENNPNQEFEIYIIHHELLEGNQRMLAHFIQKKYKHQLHFLTINQASLSNIKIKTSDHVSIATYFRILLPNILPLSLDKVLFLDSDMLILNSLKELWETNLADYYLAAVVNPHADKRKVALAIPLNQPYFNAGVLLLNLKKWRTTGMSQKIIHFIEQHPKKLIFWDQDALNACLWGQWKVVPPKWNVIKILDKLPPNIVHFVGTSKPWHFKNKHPYRSEYFYYLKNTPWRRYSPFLEYLQRIGTHYWSKIRG